MAEVANRPTNASPAELSGEFAGELVKNPEGVTCQFKW